MILGIAGGTTLSNPTANGTPQVSSLTQAAIIIYTADFIVCLVILLICFSRLARVPASERKISFALMAALPFIGVRILYSVLCCFIHNAIFSLVGGSVVAYVCMAMIEELIVLIIYLILGWTLGKLEDVQVVAEGLTGWNGNDKTSNEQA